MIKRTFTQPLYFFLAEYEMLYTILEREIEHYKTLVKCTNINDPKRSMYASELDVIEGVFRKMNDERSQWHEIPTDLDGFGIVSNIPQGSVIAYRDGTMFSKRPNDIEDWAGDIERHPQRFKYMELPKPFIENKKTT